MVDDSLTIVYCNAAWDRFALANGGADVVRARQVGRNLAPAVPWVLRDFYWRAFENVWKTGVPWEHDYECSSADVFRGFHMRVELLSRRVNRSPLVIANSLAASLPHSGDTQAGLEDRYRDADGIITMCCHCRRTKRPSGLEIWDWAPDFLRAPPRNVSHGLCGPCVQLHYGAGMVLPGA